MGDSGLNTFAIGSFSNGVGELFGNIQGRGSSTLNYSASDGPATVHLLNGTDGTASGVIGGTVSGITAIIGSNVGGNILDAGSVPNVTLTGQESVLAELEPTGVLSPNTLSGTGTGDNVLESIGSSYTLSDSSLVGQFDGSTAIADDLEGITVANLVGNGAIGESNSFNVSSWTGTGSLAVPPGNVGTVQAAGNASFTLTTAVSGVSLLRASDGLTLNLELATEWIADLSVGTGAGQLPATIDASGFSAGLTDLSVTGTGNAILYGGPVAGGSLTATGSGDNILIGEAADTTLTDTSTGRGILIGAGAGGDTLVGNRSDILVSGTTLYDSNTPANQAALDAILGEWASSDSYATRIRLITRGVRRTPGFGPPGIKRFRFIDAFNRSTIQTDSSANTLRDGSARAVPDHQRRRCSRGPERQASNRPQTDKTRQTESPPQSTSVLTKLQLVHREQPGPRDKEAQ